MKRAKWSVPEDALIQAHYPSRKLLQLLTGRTWPAIFQRASRLQITQPSTHWTTHELAILKREYPAGGSVAVREFLPHRSRPQICTTANRFGLKRMSVHESLSMPTAGCWRQVKGDGNALA